ncbi:MAG: hypothetical protein JW770_05675 [Actinobacteria bacterium]|nr:hypothetical protein [Actinomycetota bacterium]
MTTQQGTTSAKKIPEAVNRITIALIEVMAIMASVLLVSCVLPGEDKTGSISTEFTGINESGELYLFDYSKIKILPTQSIDIKIDSCNIYQDLYGDIVITGEANNYSGTTKTDMEITYSFLNKAGRNIYQASEKTLADYLRMSSKVPFILYFGDRGKYMDIDAIKIGINYKNYNPVFDGNPVVLSENHYYEKGSFFIEGSVINLGEKSIKNLKMYCTFYDKKDRVVFVRKCFLKRERMMPEEQQDFKLQIIPDPYLKEFESYHFEVFFEDEIEVTS